MLFIYLMLSYDLYHMMYWCYAYVQHVGQRSRDIRSMSFMYILVSYVFFIVLTCGQLVLKTNDINYVQNIDIYDDMFHLGDSFDVAVIKIY